MAKILSPRCLSSSGTVTMNPTTLEITTTEANQKYSFIGLENRTVIAHTFAFKATGADLMVKFNDETDPNEEMVCEADVWEIIGPDASIANFTVKAASGAKFKLRIMT